MKDVIITLKTKGTHLLMCFFFLLSCLYPCQGAAAEEISIESLTETEAAAEEENEDEVVLTVGDGSIPEPYELHAYSALLYDAEAGRVLYEKNGYEVLPMASTTKIMTLLVVLENSEPDEIVTVSKNAAMQPDVQLNMNTGEQYYVKDLCYSLMLESHNDTAVALAEHVGGSVEGFAAMMNAKAKALGAYSGNFVTPNGLDADGHGINAADLAKIAAYAVGQEEFIEITNTASYSFTELTKGRGFTVSNKNRFLTMMDGAIGVKTGFTGKAGYCFVGAVKRDDRLLISVVLACGWPPNKNYKWSDTGKLMEYGIKGFEKKPLLTDKSRLPELPELPVIKGQKESVALCYGEEELAELLETRLLLSGEEQISFIPELTKSSLPAPVEQGTEVGRLLVKVGKDCIKTIPVRTAEAAVPVDYKFYFSRALQDFFSGAAIKRLLFPQE